MNIFSHIFSTDQQVDGLCLHDNVSTENQMNTEQRITSIMEDEENTTVPSSTTADARNALICINLILCWDIVMQTECTYSALENSDSQLLSFYLSGPNLHC